MSVFSGSYRERHPKIFTGAPNRGVARLLKEVKRTEAEDRNARTPHSRTKKHRLGTCGCGASREQGR